METSGHLHKLEKSRDALDQALTDKQRELLRVSENIAEEINSIYEKEIFIHGFRLGSKIMCEALHNDEK